MVKRKLSRRELREDEVLSFVESAYEWMSEKRTMLIYAGSAILILFFTLWGLHVHMKSRESHAEMLLSGAIQGDKPDEESLRTLSEKYGSTRAGRIARILLAVGGEQSDGAVDQLAEVIPSLDDPAMKLTAARDAVTILAEKGKYDEGIAFLETVSSSIPEDASLFFHGWLEEERGNGTEAKKLYDQLSEAHEKSPFAAMARARSQYL